MFLRRLKAIVLRDLFRVLSWSLEESLSLLNDQEPEEPEEPEWLLERLIECINRQTQKSRFYC